MKVSYMFQTCSVDNDLGTEEQTFQDMQEEFRSLCSGPITFEPLYQSGHGCGIGDWSDLGETFDWNMDMEMSEKDYSALREEYGLYPRFN